MIGGGNGQCPMVDFVVVGGHCDTVDLFENRMPEARESC